nr:DUF3168 domain-containing protein [uncultured Massilia sp.]
MSSVKAVRALLLAAKDVTARVPADSIVAGDVPVDAALPALGIKEVSSVPIGAFDAQAEYSVVTSRVQVTAMAKAYPDVKALLDLARQACNFQSGQIAGVSVISVVRDTVGPDLQDVAGTYFQSIDFKVTYHEKN